MILTLPEEVLWIEASIITNLLLFFFMEKRAFEQTGLVPRSIIRTFDRFRRQLLKGAETSVIQEFRVSRYQVLVSVKCLASLLVIPLVVNFLAKTFFLMPLTEYLWNTQQNEIFLNLYQENRAFSELHDFEEKLFFESLIETQSVPPLSFIPSEMESDTKSFLQPSKILYDGKSNEIIDGITKDTKKISKKNSLKVDLVLQPHINQERNLLTQTPFQGVSRSVNKADRKLTDVKLKDGQAMSTFYLENSLPQKFQQKTIELAIYYNQQSIEAITNLFGDFITFITISFLFIWMEPQIIILKSFLTESLYSLSDTTKSFLLILLTDLLVGFHSPRGWEIFIELILRHFGLPENQDFIFLFVATFPVLLDTVFKYWIFRYLNQISPSTVATYHSMIE